MTDRVVTADETHRALGRSRLKHTWDYRARCAHCDQPKLTKHPLETRQLICTACDYVYPRNSFATTAIGCLCDDCGFAAILFRCGQARLCAICAKRWDDEGGTRIVERRFLIEQPYDPTTEDVPDSP